MSAPNEDQIEGKWEQTKGWVKDKAGEITNDPELEVEGEAQNTAGHAQEAWGDLKKGVGNAIESVGEAIKK